MLLNKKMAIYFTAIFFVVLDRFLKSLAINLQKPVEIIGDAIKFDYVRNYNIAFSIPFSGIVLDIVIAAIILVLIIAWVKSEKNGSYGSFALFFILLGASSNFYDRVFYGAVVDYIDVKYFTMLNIADIVISTGATLLLIALTKQGK